MLALMATYVEREAQDAVNRCQWQGMRQGLRRELRRRVRC